MLNLLLRRREYIQPEHATQDIMPDYRRSPAGNLWRASRAELPKEWESARIRRYIAEHGDTDRWAWRLLDQDGAVLWEV